MPLTRRQALVTIGATALAGSARPGRAALPESQFSFDMVIDRARDLASRPYEQPESVLPPELAALDYDAWRDIRFRPEAALLDGPFRLQMFNSGFLYTHPVSIAIVRNGVARPVAYSADLFDYGKNRFEKPLPEDLGFAGLRIHYPLNNPNVMDELAVFLGASYFRFLARGHHYGASLRGLAIGSGRPNEEFPAFRAFWVEQPGGEGQARIRLWALLDGPSAAGAYAFVVTPGQETVTEVQLHLFPRRPLDTVGIAPITSMFYVDENDRRFQDEFRPEVHDSDGLLLETGAGEWIWRPLRNPPDVRISSFSDQSPRGYGLLQRDRNFLRYEDLEARYDLRPSYWVVPSGDWGQGRVELVELPAPDETFDNIVALWRPDETPQPGQAFVRAYAIHALAVDAARHKGGTVRATFQAVPVAHGQARTSPPGTRRFLVEFAGGDLDYYLADPSKVELVATISSGRITATFLQPNPVRRGFRAGIDIELGQGETADLRAFLRAGPDTLTETWTFPWTAP
jgi:glucans biosynthesis protein